MKMDDLPGRIYIDGSYDPDAINFERELRRHGLKFPETKDTRYDYAYITYGMHRMEPGEEKFIPTNPDYEDQPGRFKNQIVIATRSAGRMLKARFKSEQANGGVFVKRLA